MTATHHNDFPDHLLQCPLCAGDIQQLHCTNCQTPFFTLHQMPCLFTTGLQQKYLWQHQMAMMEIQGQDALDNLDYILQGYDVTALTRTRLETARNAMQQSLNSILGQLKDAGLKAELHPMYEGIDMDNPTEYYHHILRDWAWDDSPSRHYEQHVNHTNLQRVLNIWPKAKPHKILFLGAGAGRLSWDLHQHFQPDFTLASDINPFLLTCANTLIKQQKSLILPELYTFPQIGYPYAKTWTLQPPQDSHHAHNRWFALGADVWNMPLKKHSVDTLVTSWLLDVTGGDVKDLIEVVNYLLAPGGYWINTGPLLYSAKLGFDLKYSAEEIFEFADMAGFERLNTQVDEIAHMASPLNARYHHEQILSFSAQKRSLPRSRPRPGYTADWLTPPWLILHHQPIPKMEFTGPMEHDFIKQVIHLVNGENSIVSIAQTLQSSLPDGVDAKEAVVALFGQLLEQMAGV